ncbi:MAG: HAD family phosphatase [Patescibacteria group bacterium]
MKNNIQAVIFDVDGLLIDSEPSWQKTYEEFLRKHNITDKAALTEDRPGIGLKDFFTELRERYHLAQPLTVLLEEYRNMFYHNFLNPGTMRLLPGAKDLIVLLAGSQLPLAIATGGHTKESMVKMLETFHLQEYFPLIVSCDEVHRGKPHPDVFLITAQKLQKQPEACLVLEDSVNGVKAGKAAGMLVYGVNKDEKIRKELTEAGADEVFMSLVGIF